MSLGTSWHVCRCSRSTRWSRCARAASRATLPAARSSVATCCPHRMPCRTCTDSLSCPAEQVFKERTLELMRSQSGCMSLPCKARKRAQLPNLTTEAASHHVPCCPAGVQGAHAGAAAQKQQAWRLTSSPGARACTAPCTSPRPLPSGRCRQAQKSCLDSGITSHLLLSPAPGQQLRKSSKRGDSTRPQEHASAQHHAAHHAPSAWGQQVCSGLTTVLASSHCG